jgi:hypothetical protein
MKPTQEQVIAWAQEACGDPAWNGGVEWVWGEVRRFAALAYEAGRKDENEAFEKELSKEDPEWLDDEAFLIVTGLLEWVRARREQ